MQFNLSAVIIFLVALSAVLSARFARADEPFDGSPWNVSTGNLSTYFIQASPIGAHPRPDVLEPPPPVEVMQRMKEQGLVAYEDYVAWGAVEREPGKWDWRQHDAVQAAVKEAGLKYVIYNWVHFPPLWLREQRKDERTLMRCLEHDQETNYLSIFDPKTLEHYDHFYRNVAAHFGDRVDDIYACILGPYGEGNYPLLVPDWVNIGHCHEGYWCADEYAIKAFADAMRQQYDDDVAKLNAAWGTDHADFTSIRPPSEIAEETFKPHPDAFVTRADRRRWLDFITWYHQAIIDFAEGSVRVTLNHFPSNKVRLKPGGNAGGVNPIAWGTYCPGYAKMATKFSGHVVLQPADWHGAYFGDKWVATAYHFYGVPLGTEPAGGLDQKGFVKRLFSDASCGTRQLFTYDFEKHSADVRRYAHLITGEPGEAEIAVLCPTTLYRLGGDLRPTIEWSHRLRDLADFDVLDELLVADGALTSEKYKVLILFQSDWIDQPILDRIESFARAGGRVLIAGRDKPRNVEGDVWWPSNLPRGAIVNTRAATFDHLKRLAAERKVKGYEGIADGVWTTRRGELTFMLNTTDQPVVVDGTEIPPHEIWSNR